MGRVGVWGVDRVWLVIGVSVMIGCRSRCRGGLRFMVRVGV